MDDGYDFTNSGIQKRVQKLRDERDEERQENGRLRAKVAKLERGNARLKERSLPFSMPRFEPLIPKTANMRVFPEETLKSIQQAQANFDRLAASMPRIEPFIPKTALMGVFPKETLKSIQQAQANFEGIAASMRSATEVGKSGTVAPTNPRKRNKGE